MFSVVIVNVDKIVDLVVVLELCARKNDFLGNYKEENKC
jgi:hypothetical protein